MSNSKVGVIYFPMHYLYLLSSILNFDNLYTEKYIINTKIYIILLQNKYLLIILTYVNNNNFIIFIERVLCSSFYKIRTYLKVAIIFFTTILEYQIFGFVLLSQPYPFEILLSYKILDSHG